MSNASLWELLKHATQLQDNNPGLNTAQAIRKALDNEPSLYNPDMPPPVEPEREVVSKRDREMRQQLVSEAERMQKREPGLRWEQAIVQVLNEHPELRGER